MRVPLPCVAIVIVNWNTWRDTVTCLESVLALDYDNCEIMVVDNGSRDDSVSRIMEWLENRGICSWLVSHLSGSPDVGRAKHADLSPTVHKGVFLIQSPENLGYAGGNNLGIRFALERGANYVLILNDDTRVSPNLLLRLVDTAGADPTTGLVGGKILVLEDPAAVQYQGGNLSFWCGLYWRFRNGALGDTEKEEMEVNFVPGCAMLARRELLEQIGLLDERYFLYAEDIEFCHRALQAGWRAKVNRDAVLWHRPIPPRGQRSLAYYYYGTRNSLFFISQRLRGLQQLSCFLFFIGGRLLLVFQWLAKGRYDYVRATWQGAADYLAGRTGPKAGPLGRQDERVKGP